MTDFSANWRDLKLIPLNRQLRLLPFEGSTQHEQNPPGLQWLSGVPEPCWQACSCPGLTATGRSFWRLRWCRILTKGATARRRKNSQTWKAGRQVPKGNSSHFRGSREGGKGSLDSEATWGPDCHLLAWWPQIKSFNISGICASQEYKRVNSICPRPLPRLQ